MEVNIFGWRFRRSIKIADGVRLNFGKSGVSLSAGTRGLRRTYHTSGRVTTSIGIPGTGLSYVTTNSKRKYEKSGRNYSQLSNINAVNNYEYYINLIRSLHKEGLEPIDWQSIAEEEEPFKKGEMGPLQNEAVLRYEEYKPGVLEKVFSSLLAKKKEKLKQHILWAEGEDAKVYEEWENRARFANGIIECNEQVCTTLLDEIKPFSDIEAFCEVRRCNFRKNGIEIDVIIKKDVVPDHSLSLTKTYKISKKDLTKTTYYDIMQDYVCSLCFRIARDMFAIFHSNTVLVNALKTVLNTSTGYYEDVPILSIKFNRGIFDMLNLDRIDPSDALKNFMHNMEFLKTKGFKPIKKLTL
ncbi:MAG TPA: DUF4236 domain-containing protein [Clostridia bacterium]|nr:DUF4236 domain-containing protein [Clostridia bacterium]